MYSTGAHHYYSALARRFTLVYLRSRGGETLPEAVDRAIQVAAAASDIVELRFNGIEILIHPTWRDTIISFWNTLHNKHIEECNR